MEKERRALEHEAKEDEEILKGLDGNLKDRMEEELQNLRFEIISLIHREKAMHPLDKGYIDLSVT